MIYYIFYSLKKKNETDKPMQICNADDALC